MQLIFNPDAGGKDFAARATDGGLASMVMRSISMCDKDINPDLLGSVVVAGGTTMMPGFVERLQEDLDRVSPPGASMMASVIPHPTSHEPGYNVRCLRRCHRSSSYKSPGKSTKTAGRASSIEFSCERLFFFIPWPAKVSPLAAGGAWAVDLVVFSVKWRDAPCS
ncbi:unnamed protein product, partial [Ectocarpus sp. 13 AM-2016]